MEEYKGVHFFLFEQSRVCLCLDVPGPLPVYIGGGSIAGIEGIRVVDPGAINKYATVRGTMRGEGGAWFLCKRDWC